MGVTRARGAAVDEEFTSFVASASPQLHRKAWLLTTSSAAADDLVQSALAPSSGSDPGCDAPELSAAASCEEVPEGEEIQVAPSGPGSDISCTEERSGHTQCTQILDAKGEVVGRRLTSRWDGTVMTEVVLRRDGGTVYAASANTLDDKWGADSPLSADRPPLTLDQLEDLVRNDAWVSYRP